MEASVGKDGKMSERCSTGTVHTTNNDTDWTKTKQSRTSLVHDTGLANGRHAKRHATLPTGGDGDGGDAHAIVSHPRHAVYQHQGVGQYKLYLKKQRLETGFSLHRFKGWLKGWNRAVSRCGSTGFDLYRGLTTGQMRDIILRKEMSSAAAAGEASAAASMSTRV
jgi:hypothetical protein